MSYKGQLGKWDIKKECENKNLILNPYDEKCLKDASYDLTPSIIAMSSKVGMLEKVYREREFKEDRYYIYAHPKDTVLIVSNEYIRVPDNIAGYVSSRVSKVVEGFGHISTTIDPEWAGAVLIAVSNPTNKPLKIYVGKSSIPDRKHNSLATVTFHYLNTPLGDERDEEAASGNNVEAEYRGMRIDLLEQVSYKKRWGVRAVMRRCIHVKRRLFTDYFFTVGKVIDKNFTDSKWDEFVREFSYVRPQVPSDQQNMSKKAKQNVMDFIVAENAFIRFKYFCKNHSTGLWVSIIVTLYIVFRAEWIPVDVRTRLEEFWNFIFPFLA